MHSRTMRSVAPWRYTTLSQVMSPTSLTTSTTRRLLQRSSRVNPATYTELSYSCDAELDDEIIGKAPSSPLFIQEREEPANLRQAYHCHEESLLPFQSFSAHKYGETRTRTEFVSKNGNQFATRKTKESGFSLKDKKSKFSLKSELRSRSTNFKPILTEVSRISYNFRNNYQNKIGIIVKLISKVFMRWKK